MTDTPDKLPALEAVAWMYEWAGPNPKDVTQFRQIRPSGPLKQGWTETPLTDLNKANEIINTLSAENARLEEANRTIAAECIKWAREAGEAKGKLEGSEAAGVVDQWREKCEQLEAENAALTAKVERMGKVARKINHRFRAAQQTNMLNSDWIGVADELHAALKGDE